VGLGFYEQEDVMDESLDTQGGHTFGDLQIVTENIRDTATPQVRAAYGHARAKNALFAAVHELWRRRQQEGLTVNHLSQRIGRSPRWIKRALSGPGEWTLKTFGELVEAMEGEIEAHALPDERSIIQVLSDRLYNKTCFLASISKMTTFPEFAELETYGIHTVRFILGWMHLGEIKTFWFPLLKRITGEDPVPVEERGRVEQMRSRWVAWGQEKEIWGKQPK
jgi:hypothetical protein